MTSVEAAVWHGNDRRSDTLGRMKAGDMLDYTAFYAPGGFITAKNSWWVRRYRNGPCCECTSLGRFSATYVATGLLRVGKIMRVPEYT